jgi:hypothetical protein
LSITHSGSEFKATWSFRSVHHQQRLLIEL